MAISPLEQLQSELTKPNQVIALVGAGVTIGSLKPGSDQAKIASWKNLLLDAVEQVEKNNQLPSPEMAATLRQNINSGDLTLALAAAQSTQKHLGESGFQRWLNNSVGTFKDALRNPPEVIQALDALQIPIITLNYDDTITHVTNRKPFTWKDDDAVGKILRGNLENVLHLHGYYERADTVVFSLEDYAEIIRHPHTQAVLQALQSTKTLLFIGCGDTFSDPNFSRLLEWAKPIFKKSSHTHFLLELKGNVASRQEGFKPEDHILVVSYGKAHDDLAEFLRSLAPTSTPKVPLPTSSATVPSGTWVNLTQPDVRIGGADKLKALVKAMLEPEKPVLVMGLAGIGKSNLCEHALQNPEVVKLFGSRRAFIRCDAVTDCINLVAQIATATNVPLGDYLEARVLSELEQSPAVIVLDNLETPWMKDTNAVEDLLRILAAVPGLVLVGGVRGSTRPKGATWTTIQPEVMSHKDARALFLEFSEAEFATDPLLDTLLRKLDGLPLAIKLLAFQAQGDPNLKGLVQRYDTKRTALLSKGADKASNLAISLELSFEQPRMNPLAQAAASVMALLPGGIKHSDIASVLEDGEEAAHILRNVGLVFDRDERLRMLAPVREHFHEAHPIDGKALVQAVEFYAGLAEELGDKIGRDGSAEAVERLTPEFGNLCKMIILATNTNSNSAFNAAYSIGRFSSFTELDAVEVLSFVLDKTNFDQDKTHLIATLGDIAFSRSDYNKAQELYEQVLYLCEKFGNASVEAYCTLKLGSIALDKSNFNKAQNLHKKALFFYRQEKVSIGEANCIEGLGKLALQIFELNKAQKFLEEALFLYKQEKDVKGQASCILGLGTVALQRLDYNKAKNLYEEALFLYKKAGNILGEANCIKCFADISLQKLEYNEAQKLFEQALPLYKKMRSTLGEANCIRGFGEIALKISNYSKARAFFTDALKLYESVDNSFSMALCHVSLSRIEPTHSERFIHWKEAIRLLSSIDTLNPINLIQFRISRGFYTAIWWVGKFFHRI